MKPLHAVPLRYWIPGLFLVGTLAGALVIFTTAWWLGLQDIENRSREELRDIGNQLLLPLRRALEQGRDGDIPPLLATISVRPDIDLVALTDESGRIIASSRYAWLGRNIGELLPDYHWKPPRPGSDRLEIRETPKGYLARESIAYTTSDTSIRTPRQALLWIDFDNRQNRRETLARALTVAGALVALGLLFMATLLFLTRRYITAPFGQLANLAQRLAAGDLDARLEIQGQGEAAVLAESLHRMAARIERNIAILHENEERLSVTLDSIGDAVLVTDEKGLITRMNSEAERLTGWKEEEALSRPLGEVFHIVNARTGEPAIDPVARVLREGKVVGLANHTALISRDGSEYQIADSAAPIRTREGEILGVVMVFHDVTEAYQAQENLARLTRQLQDLTNALPDPVFVLSREGEYLEIFGGPPRLLVSSRETLLGRRVDEMLPEPQATLVLDTIEKTLVSESPQLVEYELEVPAGKRFFEGHCAPFHVKGREAVVWLARDITRRKQAEEDAARLALYDPLTGLPNRRMFLERLEQALARAHRIGENGALLFIDLDHFKSINDTMGHLTGDLVLQEVAARIRPILRTEDMASRLGGDEFVVLLEDLGADKISASERAEAVAHKLHEAFLEPILIEGESLHLSFSAGIVVFPDNAAPEELIKRADIAMYRAKETGRDRVCFFSREFQEIAEERLQIQRDLRQGIDEDQLLLYIQPRVDTRGRWRGGEVLVRWQHPSRGLLAPAAFVPIAEESGLIISLDRWVISRTIHRLALEQLPEGFSGLSVNLSGPLMLQKGFVEEMETWLAYAGLEAQKVELEITERLLLTDQQAAVQVINGLRDFGIRFAIDDFGTGYSSLRYLQRLPLDRLKIDRSFVARLPDHSGDAAIVETILAMARHLELDVIGEGVEHEQQQQFLADRGCRRFQGFLYARPMPWETFFQALAEHQEGEG